MGPGLVYAQMRSVREPVAPEADPEVPAAEHEGQFGVVEFAVEVAGTVAGQRIAVWAENLKVVVAEDQPPFSCRVAYFGQQKVNGRCFTGDFYPEKQELRVRFSFDGQFCIGVPFGLNDVPFGIRHRDIASEKQIVTRLVFISAIAGCDRKADGQQQKQSFHLPMVIRRIR